MNRIDLGKHFVLIGSILFRSLFNKTISCPAINSCNHVIEIPTICSIFNIKSLDFGVARLTSILNIDVIERRNQKYRTSVA